MCDIIGLIMNSAGKNYAQYLSSIKGCDKRIKVGGN